MIVDETVVVVAAAASTTTTTVVETEGESAGVFDTIKRTAGFETNSFDINVEYRTFSERSQIVKTAVIKQGEAFGKMIDQPFFRDLFKYGPLLIINFSLSAADPGKEYYVHSALLKSLDKLRNVVQVHQLSTSLIENLDVHLKFKNDKESAKMAQALNAVAKMFNVKVVSGGLNVNVDDKNFNLFPSVATDTQAASIRQLFAYDEEQFVNANLATPPPQYGAAFVKISKMAAFIENPKTNKAPILLYRHHEHDGKLPGHFESGYLQESKSAELYAARFHSIPAVIYLQPEMLLQAEDDEYENLAAVLLPKKTSVAFALGEGKVDGMSYGGEERELSDSDDDNPSATRAKKQEDARRKREGEMCVLL